MKISLIAAVAKNNVIGKDNTLIWHLPADLKYFKDKTTGHVIITGRKNYESIPEKFRPLPNRINIVITKQKNYYAPGAIIAHSLEEAIEKAKITEREEIFIIGGAQIYKEAMIKNLPQKLYITKVLEYFDGDAFFPEINTEKWKLMEKTIRPKDEKNPYNMEFCVYQY